MGSGKSPTVAPVVPQPINTSTSVGSKLDTQVETFDDSKLKDSAVNKSKLGTRGLQIPLASDTSTTPTSVSPATTGLKI